MQRKDKFLPLLTALLLLSLLVSCHSGNGNGDDTTTTAPVQSTTDTTTTAPPDVTTTPPTGETTTTTAPQPTETTVGAHDHGYIEAVTAPTCTEGGYTTYTCYFCADSYRTAETPATGHHYLPTVVEPTGTAQGYTEHICTVCNHSYRDSYTDPLSREVIVSFDRMGGTMESSDTRFYQTGEHAELPTPTKEGYTFLGWYLEETLVESGPWSITDNITLTAQWEANSYRITYDPSGGTMGYPYGSVTYDSPFGTLPTPDERFGYLFLGWYLDDTLITADTVSHNLNDITLTAKWKAPEGTGTAGKDLTWTLCADGVVRLTGTGTAIAEGAFAGMEELTTIELPSTLRDIGAGAFENCVNLKEITIPGSVGVVRSSLFAGCSSLESVTLGSGISVINDGAFRNCAALTTLTLPQSLFQIYNPFEGCSSLSHIRYEGSSFHWSVVVKDDATIAALSAAGVSYTYEVAYPKTEE